MRVGGPNFGVIHGAGDGDFSPPHATVFQSKSHPLSKRCYAGGDVGTNDEGTYIICPN